MKKQTTAFTTHETTVTDLNTGEIHSTEITRSTFKDVEPPYIKIYLDDITSIYNLPNSSSDLLLELLRLMSYDGQIILNSSIKKIIQQRVNYKNIASVDNYISALCKKEVFYRVDRGIYKPNPFIFGRGDWKSISKLRDAWLHIQYNNKGERKVVSSFSEEIEKNKGAA